MPYSTKDKLLASNLQSTEAAYSKTLVSISFGRCCVRFNILSGFLGYLVVHGLFSRFEGIGLVSCDGFIFEPGLWRLSFY
jgi:hypothetical protein